MPITNGDVKLLKSAVMADVPEGGGAPTGNAIVDGVSNAIFPDISELDRAGGRVNLRKTHISIQTDDVDTYYGANIIVADPPEDPRVSVTLFTTESTFDTRIQAQSRVEAYLNKGPQWNGYLYENHISGQMIVQFFQRPNTELPIVGQTLVLIENEGLGTQKEQYIRATEVSYVEQTFTYNVDTDYKAWIVSVTLSDALRYDFTGSPPSRTFARTTNGTNPSTTNTLVRDTVVADAAVYSGVQAVTEAIDIGDFTIKAASVYSQLVPSAQTETPLVDVNPMQQSLGYIPIADGTITYTIAGLFNTSQSMYIGGTPLPGSLSITVGGTTISDDQGLLLNGSTEVGQIDYENGLATLSSNVFGTGSLTVTVVYTPAEVPRTFGPSTYQAVTAENRGLNWIRTLESSPAACTLSISYQVSGRWYVMRDQGEGQIRPQVVGGAGAGQVNYNTATVNVTLGALPDVGSIILYQWVPGVNISKLNAIDLGEGAKVMNTFTLPFRPVLSSVGNPLTATWNRGGIRTVVSNAAGELSGYGTGRVVDKQVIIAPSDLPAKDAVITFTYDAYVTVVDTVTTNLVANGTVSGKWEYDIPNAADARSINISIYTSQSTVKINQTWYGPLVNRFTKLYTLGDRGNTLYATIQDSYETGATFGGYHAIVGTVDWVTGKFLLDKEFYLQGHFQSMQTLGNGNGSGWPMHWTYGSAKHTVNASSLLVSPITTYTTVIETNKTTVLSWDKMVLQPKEANPGGGVSALGIKFTRAGSRFFQGMLPGTTDKLYTSFSPASNTGTQVGTVDGYGKVTLTSWDEASDEVISNWVGAWSPPVPGVNRPYFLEYAMIRTAASPLRPSSVSVTVVDQNGNTLTATSNADGDLIGDLNGWVDYENGLIFVSKENPAFDPVAFAAATPAAPYGGAPRYISIDAATLRYNAVTYSYLPLDADIIGLDPVRLPTDGRVPIFRSGGFAVVGHTGSITATVSNGQTIDCARVRLSRVRVIGNNGVVINTGYTQNLEAGTVTFTDVTGYSQPVTIQHRIEDMAVVRDTQITGEITFTRPMTHNYPVPGSYVSSALVASDLFSRVSLIFDQASWVGNTWGDAVNGSAATATFNNTTYPIVVTNRGCLTERWLVQFTGTTSFQVIGENVGVIAVGNTSADCAPNNPATGVPYFTIPALGWGSGWSTGNILRFNTIAAGFPVWVVRTIQQGPETVTDDDFTLLIRGDTNTP